MRDRIWLLGLFLISVAIGLTSLTFYYLFFNYPVEHSNWQRITAAINLLLGISAGGICTSAVLALFRRTQGKRRIALLCAAILPLAFYTFSGAKKSVDEPRSVAGSSRYDFSVDWMSHHTKNWQTILAPMKDRGNLKAIEIGSYEGRSAIWFLENILTHPTSSITCIDIFDEPIIESRYDKNIAVSGSANKVKKIKAPSAIALKQLEPETYDFIYIDGSHLAKDVLIDAVLSWELLRPNGIVIFDDYGWSPRSRYRNPKTAIDPFTAIYAPYIEIVYRGETQIALRKKTQVDLDDQGTIGQISKSLQALF